MNLYIYSINYKDDIIYISYSKSQLDKKKLLKYHKRNKKIMDLLNKLNANLNSIEFKLIDKFDNLEYKDINYFIKYYEDTLNPILLRNDKIY